MGISEARYAAQAKKLEVVSGGDPNEEKRKVTRDAAIAAKGRRNLSEVLDQYDRMKLSQLRSATENRRALGGPSGILKAFLHKDIASIDRSDIADAVRAHAQKSPIAANRSLAYVKAFLN